MSESVPTSEAANAPDFSGLSALFINCTLKRSPEISNTQALVDASAEIMARHGVTTEVVRLIDHDVATGVWPDMTEHGWEHDDWPTIQERVWAANILVIAGPIWLGEAGPGPSYLDPGSGGPENEFTSRNTTFMTWNLLHLAEMLRVAGGIPAYGNQRSAWDDGERFDWENPEYRRS